MKDSTKETLTTFALVLAVGLMCGGLGIIGGIAIGENKSAERLLSIEKRLDLHDRIDSVLVASINAFYKYVGVTGKMGSVEQDTIGWETIYGERREPTLDHDPVDPPVGLEAIIERSVYQKIERPGEWEWNPEAKKWEKTEE